MTAYYNEHDPYAAQWLRNLIKAGHIAQGIVDERDIKDVKPTELIEYTQCHFFAGIGVWSYSLRQAGWPDDRPVWTGSCPCQPFSAAGRGVGFVDERHLWPHFFHLIESCRPNVLFGEQVASKDGLAWLDLVQTDLEGARYASGVVDMCAAGFGAPHIRQRLWFVAERLGNARGEIRGGGIIQRPRESDSKVSGQTQKQRLNGGSSPSRLADTDTKRFERERRSRSPQGQRATELRETSRVADTNSTGSQSGSKTSATTGHGDTSESESSPDRHEQPSPTNGFWGAADWLFCRDGKWRPVEPGTFPLVNGLTAGMGCSGPGKISPYRAIKDPQTGKSIGQAPWRTGMLKGYGNAINAEVAQAFIEACM